MMDAPSANQSRTPCQPWAGQNGWSPASPPGPPCDPLPGLQRLSLSSPSDLRPDRDRLQGSTRGCRGDRSASPPGGRAHLGALDPRNAEHSVRAPSMAPAAGRGRRIPPCSLPLVEEGSHPRRVPQMPFYSPHSPYRGMSPPFQPPYTPDGPMPSHQNHLPAGSPSPGANSPLCTPRPVFERANSESAAASQQPHWTLAAPSRGTINQFVPDAAAPHRNVAPQSPTAESRYGLDPELLPSVVKVIAEDAAEWEGKVFASEPFSRLPPLATTSCIMEDRGNASPLAIRSASYCVPCEGQTALLSRLPLAALLTPLARLSEPLALSSEAACVTGCGSCGASMCPAMGWQDCGQRFFCPFCGKLSEVPWHQYQPTRGPEGVRVDRDQRPELSMGSYETLGPQTGEPAALILAVDVSASAVRGGHLEFATQQIFTLLTSLNSGDGVRVGLMTYDSRIHLYDLSPALTRPHMLVIAEAEELQLPVREGLLVPLEDCIHGIHSVLQLIPQFSPEGGGSGGVPVELPVRAGLAVLQARSCPGKLLVFHAAPLVETGDTNPSSGFFGSNKAKSIFQPSAPAVSLAEQCVEQGCGVHLFVLSQQDVGGAWPGHIPYLTGGALHAYDHLQGELDRERFSADLKRAVETDTGYKAELRVFVSKDVRVSGCYGLFLPGDSPGRVAMATLDRRTTLAVELAHNRALDETRGVAVQTVLSYSTQAGCRRTRVHTLTLRCSRHLQDTFRQYQAQTLLTFYCKKIYCSVLERPLQELREELQTEVTEALASYRKHCCSASVSAGQLVLPQYLRALPVYINSLRKSEVLLPGLRSSVHQRLQQRCQVLAMDAAATSAHFYPLLLPLPLSVDGAASSPHAGEALRCCAASMEPGRLYLVHAPLTLLLWVGSRVPACTLMALFNAGCFSSLPSGETKLPVLENRLSARVRSLVHALNSEAPCARKLWVVKQGDACEEVLQRHLVEDKSPNGGASYADFLYHLHVNSVRLLQ